MEAQSGARGSSASDYISGSAGRHPASPTVADGHDHELEPEKRTQRLPISLSTMILFSFIWTAISFYAWLQIASAMVHRSGFFLRDGRNMPTNGVGNLKGEIRKVLSPLLALRSWQMTSSTSSSPGLNILPGIQSTRIGAFHRVVVSPRYRSSAFP